MLEILWNSINLYRNGTTWNTKFNFYKSPASNRDFIWEKAKINADYYVNNFWGIPQTES